MTAPGKPVPRVSELVYLTEDGIAVEDLIEILEQIHSLIYTGMPGQRITELRLTDHALTITLTERSQ